jgi:hypothetical protein
MKINFGLGPDAHRAGSGEIVKFRSMQIYMRGRGKIHTQFLSEDLRGTEHLEHLSVHRRIILNGKVEVRGCGLGSCRWG